MMSISRDPSSHQFDYRFDADGWAREKGFESYTDFERMAQLIEGAYQMMLLDREIERINARIAELEGKP